MQLQQIRPDFSGSAESMAQAQKGIAQVGTFANEWMDRLVKEKAVATEEARYQTELARQKVLDDRATAEYEQRQAGRGAEIKLQALASRAEDIGGGYAVTKGAEAGDFQKYLQPQVQQADVRAQELIKSSPELQAKYQQALSGEDFMQIDKATGQMVPMSAADRAVAERLTREQILTEGQRSGLGIDAYKKGMDAYNLSQGKNLEGAQITEGGQVIPQQPLQYQETQRVQTGGQPIRSTSTTTPDTVVKGTPGVKPGTVEAFLTKNPNIKEQILKGSVSSAGVVKGTPVKYTTNNFVERNPTEGDGSVFSMKSTGHQSVRPGISFTNLANKLADTMPMTSSLINTVGHAIAGDKTNLQIAKEKVLSDPSMYTQRPASSVRDPNAKGKAYLAKFEDKLTTTTKAGYGLESFGKLPIQKQVDSILSHTAEPDKDAVRAYFAGKAATEDKVVKGKTVKGDVIGYTPTSMSIVSKGKISTPTGGSIDISGIAKPKQGVVTAAYEQFAKQASSVGMPKAVADGFKAVAMKELTKRGVTAREAGLEGILKSTGADGSLTPTQERELKIFEGRFNALTKEYEMNQTQANADRAYALQVQQLNNQMAQWSASHSLAKSKFELDKKSASGKAPEGYIRLLDGTLVPEAQAKAAWSKAGGKAGEYEAMTPAEKIMQQEEQVSKMQGIVKENTGWLKDVFESDETQRATARTKLGLK